jgi:dihydrolipoamide dehydrogenase
LLCKDPLDTVWEIGDLVGEPMFAHKASAPAVCFTEPETVSVGLDPTTAGPDAIVGVFPFLGNGRALSLDAGADGGFRPSGGSGRQPPPFDAQAVGQHVSELSDAFTQAPEMGAVLADIAGAVPAHHSLGEALYEAALKALGHAIHLSGGALSVDQGKLDAREICLGLRHTQGYRYIVVATAQANTPLSGGHVTSLLKELEGSRM